MDIAKTAEKKTQNTFTCPFFTAVSVLTSVLSPTSVEREEDGKKVERPAAKGCLCSQDRDRFTVLLTLAICIRICCMVEKVNERHEVMVVLAVFAIPLPI